MFGKNVLHNSSYRNDELDAELEEHCSMQYAVTLFQSAKENSNRVPVLL